MAEQSIEIARLLVVSRESSLLDPLRSASESNSWHVEAAVSVRDAIERIQSGDPPNLVLIDVPLGDGGSRHVLRSLRQIDPSLPAIVVCFPEDAERNAEAIRLGAQVLIKPLDDDQLVRVIRQCLFSKANGKGEAASEDIEQLGRDSAFVSASPISQKLRTQVQVLAEAEVPVLITGETGTGKDTVARLIHQLSIRSGFEFLKLNCADTPAALLDEELFGNVSQGNGKNGNGNLEVANNGTIFFDEITEMPLSTQSRLMQVLQNKASVKSSRSNGTTTGFRLLAATSANVERAVAERRLREDLYCKLSAFTINVPPLRQRPEEIVLLMQHLMHRLSRQYGLAARTFSTAALSACKSYSWPGNLTELEAFVKRYLVVGDKDLLLNEMCSDLTNPCDRRVVAAPAPPAGSNGADDVDPGNEIEGGQTRPKSLKAIIQTVKSKAEKNAIEIALQRTGWNRKAAARILQVSYRGLLYKIDQYHLIAPHPYVSRFPYNGADVSSGKELKRN